MTDSKAVLELRNVDKSFGPIDVLHEISLKVREGEVLCLLGDNGAGKSTLIKILSGVHAPTRGTILMDGLEIHFDGPKDAARRGIATVHQFGGTFPLMSIGRSFFVGVEPTKGWGPFKVFDRKRANEIAVKAVRDFGITRIEDGERLVGGLSGGERQSLAIARAVFFGARVLILDEPTAALGVKQAAHVLRIVNEAKRRGLAVIFITHQVMHAMAVGDHYAVLIRGAIAADFRKGEKSREEITDLMAGGETMAGVSVSTIDRIMNGRAQVRPATATRVLAAAEALAFYALPTLRERLNKDKPAIRLGFLLQQSNRTFYRMIAEALHVAASESSLPVKVVVEHMDDLSPEAVSSRILRLGAQVQGLAVVSAEHPRIAHAIEALAGNGVPTYGLISELTASCSVGYVGLDNWRVGRTAAWAMTGLCKKPGRVGIVVGNHRYRCQELNESGFRSYFREHAAEFTLLEPAQTFEDKSIARDVTEQLLRREPGMVGLYISGGGMVGVLEALKASGRGSSMVTVGYELTTHTRMGLVDHDLSLVLAHPIAKMASDAIGQMLHDLRSGTPPGKRMISFDIYTPENI